MSDAVAAGGCRAARAVASGIAVVVAAGDYGLDGNQRKFGPAAATIAAAEGAVGGMRPGKRWNRLNG